MRIVCISDTHGFHREIEDKLPPGDVIVHAGDFTDVHDHKNIKTFLEWYRYLPYKKKILVAGNHDIIFDRYRDYAMKALPKEITYLCDSGCTFEGVNFWGSPVQPEFFNWAFNRQRGEEIKKHWDMIPSNTDVLITHGPPKGINDNAPRPGGGVEVVGCEDLLNAIRRIKPKVHVCGHIHFSYGSKIDDVSKCICINASVVNEQYKPCNAPFVYDYPVPAQ